MQIYSLTSGRHGTFLYNRQDEFVGRSLELYGEWSEAEILLFRQLIEPGCVVVEAGSNIGAHTVWFSRAVGDRGRVIAYEPQRSVFQLLCANLALNERFNVDARCEAIGRTDGHVETPVMNPFTQFNFGSVSCHARGDVNERVPLRTIDSLGLERLDFIKADIEGYELEMLHGARHTIERHRPVIFLEFLAQYGPGDISQEVCRQLGALGYDCHYYLTPLFLNENHKGARDNLFPGGTSFDLLCTPREKFTVTGLSTAEGKTWQQSVEQGWCVPQVVRCEPVVPSVLVASLDSSGPVASQTSPLPG